MTAPEPPVPSEIRARDAVERAIRGDMEALGDLFVLYGPFVRRVLTGILGTGGDVDDVAQDVFLQVHRSIPRFRGDSAFTTWLHPIAVRCAMNCLRRRRQRFGPALEPVVVSERTPCDDLNARRLMNALFKALDAMPAGRRTAFILFEVEGHSIEETARLMASGRAAAKSRIWFARRDLMRRAKADPLLAGLLTELLEERSGRTRKEEEGIHVRATEEP